MKQIFLAAACVMTLAGLVLGGPINEGQNVQDAMKATFMNGLSAFGGVPKNSLQQKTAPAEEVSTASKPTIYSHYTANLRALGGGKPRITDQYRNPKYVPLAPSVLPAEHPVMPNNKLTPEAAAQIYVPQRPYQYTGDIL